MLVDLMNNLTRKDGQKGKLSVSTKQEVHKVLVSIFKRAIDWNVLKENPMEGVQMPKEKQSQNKNLNVYSKEEIELLMEVLRTDPAPYHWFILIRLAIATGMRRGELLGLEWRNVNLETGIVKIKQIISKTRDGGHEIKAPKYNSIRSVHLSE